MGSVRASSNYVSGSTVIQGIDGTQGAVGAGGATNGVAGGDIFNGVRVNTATGGTITNSLTSSLLTIYGKGGNGGVGGDYNIKPSRDSQPGIGGTSGYARIYFMK